MYFKGQVTTLMSAKINFLNLCKYKTRQHVQHLKDKYVLNTPTEPLLINTKFLLHSTYSLHKWFHLVDKSGDSVCVAPSGRY